MKSSKLNGFFFELEEAGVDFNRMSAIDLRLVKEISNRNRSIIWINNHAALKPVFVNDAGLKYYGYERNDLTEEGFNLYGRLIHPDHFNDVHRTITHFSQYPKQTFYMPYLVKHVSGAWRWTFTEARALNFNKHNKAVNVLTMVYDLENLVNRNPDPILAENHSEQEVLYDSLTQREKQVLDLIAEEFTSAEIAAALNISTSTVDTHRKHLIRKLKVRSSIGLVRYSLMFSRE